MPRAEQTSKLPLVSVIIPAYNAAEFLAEAIDSALEQDYPNKEIIVVNDGSTDQTEKVLSDYGSRIRYINQVNSGVAAARNTGLSAADGDYIAFLDADDIWLPGKLRMQIAYMEEHPDIDLVQARWAECHPGIGDYRCSEKAAINQKHGSEPSDIPAIVPERSGWIYHILLTGFVVWTGVVVLRRRLIDRVGKFDEELPIGEDFHFWLRASQYTQIHTLDRTMALYRRRDNSVTGKCWARNYIAEIVDEAIKKWGTVDRDGSRVPPVTLRKHRAKSWATFAYKQLHSGRSRGAVRSCIYSLSIWPFAIAVWKRLGGSLLCASGILETKESRRT